MQIKKKKTSGDYGLFCFRLSKDERLELISLLNKAKKRLNQERDPDEFVITKNDILFEAVKLGLPMVKVKR